MKIRSIVSIAAGVVAGTLTAVEIAAGSPGLAIAGISLAAGTGAGAAVRVVWGGIAGTFCVAALAAALLAATAAGPARAHYRDCGPSEAMRQRMALEYGERQAAMGTAGTRNAAELWINEATRSWTLLGIWPEGLACIVAGGKAWEETPPSTAPAREG